MPSSLLNCVADRSKSRRHTHTQSPIGRVSERESQVFSVASLRQPLPSVQQVDLLTLPMTLLICPLPYRLLSKVMPRYPRFCFLFNFSPQCRPLTYRPWPDGCWDCTSKRTLYRGEFCLCHTMHLVCRVWTDLAISSRSRPFHRFQVVYKIKTEHANINIWVS